MADRVTFRIRGRRAAIAALAAGVAICYGTKFAPDGNSSPRSAPLPAGSAAVAVTDADIARGWRVESVATNENLSYEMPSDAAYVGNWHVHGARTSIGNNRIDFGEFAFPLGTNDAAISWRSQSTDIASAFPLAGSLILKENR